MPNTTIHTAIDTSINAQANHIFSTLGLSTNEAIALFLNYVVESKKMPFSVNIPNKETIVAMEDANNGKVERYDSLESMWADLDSD